ncbi:hypothetical protein C3941_02820 [Kaistia algarum]|uniref:hypothetical protein n=1 Tax=Kaistia algarum TaxID=2083279 RepID=UPI000CE85F37|nr:hypothetical protein [Kaistia algarum]MCX5512855.1 hypothetical protein [Kaistia algarum]PPE81651.1 hypothetical protein C3941_02820 [Kaistia algarum]
MDDTITLEIFEDGGVFRHGDAYDEIVDELDEALDQRDSGTVTPARYLKTLKAIVEHHPQFIDGYAHLGNALMEEGKPKLALQACLRGLEVGERAIPAGFAGPIEWGFLENRPFLRAAHGVLLSQLRLGQRREALALMEKMLAWNPNDNQGIRTLIGSEYLRAGDIEKADRFFADEAAHYPPYHYERALLRFRAGDPVAAATSLRHGFVSNLYVAEILSGHPDPAPLAIWHGSNFSEPEIARHYLEYCGDLWRRTPGAIPFVRWLYTHPKVLIERASVLECQEALLWEHEFMRRGELIDRENAARERIDDTLSKEIVQNRTDRQGRQVSPWLYQKARFSFH